ncbi:hypothetical protein HXX76_015540 [Chlamydomonas incerta]|uniref:Protein kinase domain-containing protein n=1 Tax=Chlamydomonas incerta TaxID=51695 RepID=A0A835SMI8_CHLIN|nr:hypothetical protein HXX76_015540 [Chlamydomonas incerta]|eukprot:KAG2423155.1 hypothetical protein HXX76_015540 [Chlamydomonas incerta]
MSRTLVHVLVATCLLAGSVLVRKATAAENNDTTSISSLQHLDYINATSVWCSCGAELAASFASPEVTLIIIDVDWIVVTEQDYSPFLTPIVLKRNITVWGARENPAQYPILDFQYIKAKIALGRGVYLDFHRFVTERVREPANFQAPGVDLIADDYARNLSDPSALGVVRYLSGTTLHRTCFDNNASVTSIATLPRPRFIPGRQSGHIVDLPGPAPNCTASSAPFVPLAQRCLVGSSGVYDDTVLYALSLDATGGRAIPAGYAMVVKDFMWRCYTMMALDCVASRGLVGCFYAMYPLGSFVPAFNTSVDIRIPSTYASVSSAATSAPYASSPPPTAGQQPAPALNSSGGSTSGRESESSAPGGLQQSPQGGDGGSDTSVLAPVLAGVLGGLAVLGAVAAAAWFYMRRRRRRSAYLPGGGKGDPQAAAATDSRAMQTPSVMVTKASAAPKHDGTGLRKSDDNSRNSGSAPNSSNFNNNGAAAPSGLSGLSSADVAGAADALLLAATEQHQAPVWTERTPLQAGIPLHVRVTEFLLDTDSLPATLRSPVAAVAAQQPPQGLQQGFRLRGAASAADVAAEDAAAPPAADATAADETPDGGPTSSLSTTSRRGGCTAGESTASCSIGGNSTTDTFLLATTPAPTGRGSQRRRLLQSQSQQSQQSAADGAGVVTLLPTVIGVGGFGRVVEGLFRGERVAVKLINTGLLAAAAAITAPPPRKDAAAAEGAEVQTPRAVAQLEAAGVESAAAGAAAEAGAGAAGEAASAAATWAIRSAAETSLFNTSPAAAAAAGYGGAAAATSAPGAPATVIASSALACSGGQQQQQPLSPLAGTELSTNYDDGWLKQLMQPSGGLLKVLMLQSPPAAAAAASPAADPNATAAGAADANQQPHDEAANNKNDSNNNPGEGGLGGVVASALLSAGAGLAATCANHDNILASTAAAVQQPAAADPYGGDRQAAALSAALAQEVAVLARVRHPNIVRLLAANLTPPVICLVLERMETNLERVLYGGDGDGGGAGNSAGGGAAEGQPAGLPLSKAVGIAVQVANALACLHPTILHRDLKPANVLISGADTDTPLAKLADFGLSRLRDTVLVTQNPEVGTVPYMAPETFNLENYTNSAIHDRSDCYAFGVLLWELIVGRKPWKGCQLVQIAYQVTVLGRRLPLEPLQAAGAPHKLIKLIVACWDADPLRRPAAAEIVKELLLVQEQLQMERASEGAAAIRCRRR